jgi:hypothetical protein
MAELTPEERVAKIEGDYDKVMRLLERISDPNKTKLITMFNEIGSRFCMAPASWKTEFHNCFPGGLIDHSLRVCKNLFKLTKTFYDGQWDEGTLILVSLLHCIGSVGNLEHEQYVPQKSKWHKDKGMLYEFNNDLTYMETSDRSLFLLQSFEVTLSEEEFLAIKLFSGSAQDSNKMYIYNQPILAQLLNQAYMLAIRQEKDE